MVGQSHKITVCVEGNIASGKSSFLKGLKSLQQGYKVLNEPMAKWMNCGGHNLLKLMYQDPVKWSFCFESYVQVTMLENHTKEIDEGKVKVMERSIYSAQYCFVENLRNQNYLSLAEHAVLEEWFEFAKTALPIRPDLIVYLRTRPEVAYERLVKRGRTEEDAVTLDYLTRIHNLHENWLMGNQKYLPCRVWVVDGNMDENEMRQIQLLLKQKLQEVGPLYE